MHCRFPPAQASKSNFQEIVYKPLTQVAARPVICQQRNSFLEVLFLWIWSLVADLEVARDEDAEDHSAAAAENGAEGAMALITCLAQDTDKNKATGEFGAGCENPSQVTKCFFRGLIIGK